jgi:3-phenylpropionate/cinnamic acid dioxygenase small subunit
MATETATLSAQDRLDVMDLIASYALCIDDGDIDGWVANFLPDAVLDHIGGRASGEAEIRAWVTRLMSSGRVGGTPAQLRHFVGLPRVEALADGRAHVRTYCVILAYDPAQKIEVPLVGSYEDTCVKVEGRWRFAHRIIRGDLGVTNRPA